MDPIEKNKRCVRENVCPLKTYTLPRLEAMRSPETLRPMLFNMAAMRPCGSSVLEMWRVLVEWAIIVKSTLKFEDFTKKW